MDNPENDSQGYVAWNDDDARYGGAVKVIEQEVSFLKEKRGKVDKHKLKGIALSGGGIRSASFCLGVLQVLARENRLKDFEYLSTVSGGGYIGGSLSWLWSGLWKQKRPQQGQQEKQACTRTFGTGRDDFPYGCGERNSSAPDADMNRDQARLMRHLRQHGKYLIPGKGIGFMSFLSVLLRSITMGFVTILALVSLGFHLLHLTPVFDDSGLCMSYMLLAGFAVLIFYFLALLIYGLLAIGYEHKMTLAYLRRRRWETWIKWPLVVALLLLFVGAAESLRLLLEQAVIEAGGAAALAGSLIAWFSQQSKATSYLKIIPRSLVIYAGVLLMFLGLAVLSDQLACWLLSISNAEAAFNPGPLAAHAGVVAIILLSAWLVPVNKVSIHRYYRDRLMETFMPDVCDVLVGGDSFVATAANQTGVHKLKDTLTDSVPYHIINTNIVLVESEIAKFRGRGGDNFILSPCYSGSNATGWRQTETLAGGSITLPTAVAISGAAANPDAGVAGKGITVNPFVSALMAIFNLRLGYWCVNPAMKKQKTNPNYLIPGFWGWHGSSKINEKSSFVQLSDGGHFENLAMYELLRRHCKLIICCDAEQDKDFAFESLANVMEKVRVDFGIEIELDADDLTKLQYSVDEHGNVTYAESGYLIAEIRYPDAAEASGKLVYIKTTLPHDLPGDIIGYQRKNPDFPDETTADQFFDETQMEAYRILGKHIATAVVGDGEIAW